METKENKNQTIVNVTPAATAETQVDTKVKAKASNKGQQFIGEKNRTALREAAEKAGVSVASVVGCLIADTAALDKAIKAAVALPKTTSRTGENAAKCLGAAVIFDAVKKTWKVNFGKKNEVNVAGSLAFYQAKVFTKKGAEVTDKDRENAKARSILKGREFAVQMSKLFGGKLV